MLHVCTSIGHVSLNGLHLMELELLAGTVTLLTSFLFFISLARGP